MAVDPLGLTLAAMGIVSYITDTIAIDGDNAEVKLVGMHAIPAGMLLLHNWHTMAAQQLKARSVQDLRALREEVHGLAPILEKLQQRAEQLRSPEALRHLSECRHSVETCQCDETSRSDDTACRLPPAAACCLLRYMFCA